MQELVQMTNRKAAPVSTRANDAPRRGYRPREIARMYGLAPATVYAAIYEGCLRSHRVGKAIVVPPEAIDEWLGISDPAA